MKRALVFLGVLVFAGVMFGSGLRIGLSTAKHEVERACWQSGQFSRGDIAYQCAPVRIVTRRSGEKTA